MTILVPSPDMPEAVVRHLPVAEQNAQVVLQSIKISRATELQALTRQLSETMSAKTPAKSRLIRIRHLADQTSALFSAKSACSSGCSHCCHIDVTIPRSEAVLLSKTTGRALHEPVQTRRIDQAPDTSYVGSPCPFLAGSRCSAYGARPLLCRTLVNLDTSSKLCELVPNVPIPVPYLNTTTLRAAFTFATQGEDFADIREWFPA